jgi:hypothetical protein
MGLSWSSISKPRRRLGLHVPPMLIARTDEMIESRIAGCLLWLKSRPQTPKLRCPLFPRKRTFTDTTAMSVLCQERTHALQQLAPLLGAFRDIKRDQHVLLAWSSGRRAGGVRR